MSYVSSVGPLYTVYNPNDIYRLPLPHMFVTTSCWFPFHYSEIIINNNNSNNTV